MASDVSFIGLAASAILVAVAALLSWREGLGLERPIIWAALRAVSQLLLVGLALTLVLDPKSPMILAWLWVVAMLLFAADVVRRRAPMVPGMFTLALASFAAAAVVTLGVLFGLGVFPLEARALVPLAGMMVGNSMTGTVLATRRFVDDLADKRDEVEARLALGLDSRQAARPYAVRALRSAMTPQIETTKAVGIVFLPGAMTGLILAGVAPIDAVRVQAVVMYLILGAVATTTAVVMLGLVRRLFTSDHRLISLQRPDEG
ncbi:MAG: iron export ABC transporter permease subunit FetB [Actinomycetota bacterium]